MCVKSEQQDVALQQRQCHLFSVCLHVQWGEQDVHVMEDEWIHRSGTATNSAVMAIGLLWKGVAVQSGSPVLVAQVAMRLFMFESQAAQHGLDALMTVRASGIAMLDGLG